MWTLEQRVQMLEASLGPILELFASITEGGRSSSIWPGMGAPSGPIRQIELSPEAAKNLENFYSRLRVYMDSQRKTLPGHYLHHDRGW
jgi:hypothetical protein